MTLKCPACGKPGQAEVCTRCACDLTPLERLRRAAEASVLSAQACLVARDWAGALEHASRSWDLCHSPTAARLAFLAAAAAADTVSAWRWYARGCREP